MAIIFGTKNNDVLVGTSSDDVIFDGDGNDVIVTAGGNDVIFAGKGGDIIDGGADNDTIHYGSSDAAVQVNLATHIGHGGFAEGDFIMNVENLVGSSFNDILTGSSSGDVIIGGAGADQLTGGAGSDTFRYRNGDASAVDTITDFDSAAAGSGGDVLDISDLLIGAPTLNAGNVSQYLDIRESGSDSIISIDRDGTGATYGFQDFAVLTGVTGLNLNTLLANNNIDYTP